MPTKARTFSAICIVIIWPHGLYSIVWKGNLAKKERILKNWRGNTRGVPIIESALISGRYLPFFKPTGYRYNRTHRADVLHMRTQFCLLSTIIIIINYFINKN